MAFHLITGPSVSGIPETVPGHVPARSGLSTSINRLFPGPYFRLYNLPEENFFTILLRIIFGRVTESNPKLYFITTVLNARYCTVQHLSTLLINVKCTMSCTASHTIHTYQHMYNCISTVYKYSNRSYLYNVHNNLEEYRIRCFLHRFHFTICKGTAHECSQQNCAPTVEGKISFVQIKGTGCTSFGVC
jgi:hypothetical protein